MGVRYIARCSRAAGLQQGCSRAAAGLQQGCSQKDSDFLALYVGFRDVVSVHPLGGPRGANWHPGRPQKGLLRVLRFRGT